MTRVIVHPGFHKTGTSSLQTYLSQNAEALKPWLSYYGKNDFPAAGAIARRYASHPFVWHRIGFRRAFRAFLASVPDAPVIVISRETFAGSMPGHRDWRGRDIHGYAATAIPICREVRRELIRRFGQETQVEFLFTIRERESWIRSVYGHLLRSIHLPETFEQFRARFPNLIDLRAEAERIGKALAPCPVHVVSLEDVAGDRAGPATAVLDLAGVPDATRAMLPRAHRQNRGQSVAMAQAFLQMNLGQQDRDEMKRQKDRMIREENR